MLSGKTPIICLEFFVGSYILELDFLRGVCYSDCTNTSDTVFARYLKAEHIARTLKRTYNKTKKTGEATMKKNMFFKACSLLLSSALLAGALSGCGGKNNPTESDDARSGTPSPDEMVYMPEYTSLPSDIGNISYVCTGTDKIYFASYTYSWDNMGDGEVILYAEENGQEGDAENTEGADDPETDGEETPAEPEPFDPDKYLEDYYYDNSAIIQLYSVDLDGSNLTELTEYSRPSLPEGSHGEVNINSMFCDSQGSLWVIENAYTYHYELPEDFDPENDYAWNYYVDDGNVYTMRKLDAQGREVGQIDLTEASRRIQESMGWFYVGSVSSDSSGNLYLCCNNCLLVMDSAGEVVCQIDANNYIQNVFTLSDGRVYACGYTGEGFGLMPVDLNTRSFGTAIPLPFNVYQAMPGGGEYDICYNKNTSFYGYNLETETETKLLNWLDCDINNDELSNTMILEDGRIICITYNWSSSGRSTELITLSQVPADQVPQKTVLTLACMYLDYYLRRQIIDFNRRSNTVRITVKDYSEFNTEDDYNAGLTKLATEIISGDVPDLLDVSGLPIKQYVAKGLIEDLYPYLDSDSTLSRDSLVQGFRRAMEINGGLYQASPNFTIMTVVGRGSVVGREPGWTLSELMDLMAQMPEGTDYFDMYTTRDTILNQALMFNMDSFVDWQTGKCSFDSDEFIKLLEFANSFPAEFDWENYDWEIDYESEFSRIRTGKQLLSMFYAYSFDYFQMYNAMFEGDMVFKGFPSGSGVGNVMQVDTGLAMTTRCKDKESAWQFVRTLFTEEYQNENARWNFPTNQKVFDDILKEAMTPQYYTDENGEQVEISKGSWGWEDDQIIEIYALKQEEADRILELINSVQSMAGYDEEIYNIIVDQTAAYFNGQKSARDTAALVQSRVNLYVNEHR